MSDDTVTEVQFVDFKCPSCGEQNSFPESLTGSAQECVGCNQAVIIPKQNGEGRLVPLPITTSNLVLRKFGGEDWKDLLQLFSSTEFFNIAPVKLEGEEQIVRWLEEDAVVKVTTPGVPFILAAQTQKDRKVIGCLTLSFSDADRLQAVLFLALHPDFQGSGLGEEAMRGALGFCFDGIGLHRVQGFCDSANAGAGETFQKIGMRREGEFVCDHKVGDQWANTTAYAILRDEFKSAASR